MSTLNENTSDRIPVPLRRLLFGTSALPAAVLGLAMAFAPPAAADTIFSNYTGTNCSCGFEGGSYAEEFTPTANYDFSSAAAFISNVNLSVGHMSLALYSSVSGLPGVELWPSGSRSVPAATFSTITFDTDPFLGLISASYSGTPIPLDDGTPYFLEVNLSDDGLAWEGGGSPSAPFAVYDGSWSSTGSAFLQFDVTGTPTSASAVPEPASLTLLAAGLAGMIATRRRQRPCRPCQSSPDTPRTMRDDPSGHAADGQAVVVVSI